MEARKILGEGTRKNAKVSTKTLMVSRNGVELKSPKSADKLRAVVTKKYSRNKKSSLPLFGESSHGFVCGFCGIYARRVVVASLPPRALLCYFRRI